MKPIHNRLVHLSRIVLAITSATCAHAAPFTWTGTTGNWSDATKWTGGTPDNDGTADLIFNDISSTYTATVNPAALIPSTNDWSVNSLTFADTGAGSNQSNVIAGAPSATLTLGAGGITQNENTSPTLSVSLIAAASQTWNINNQRSNDKQQGLDINGNLTLNNGVIVTKSRTGGTRGDLWFNAGTTTTVGTGAFTLAADTIGFTDVSQVGRLGSNALTIDNSSVNLRTRLDFRYNANSTFANGITFTGWAGANNSGTIISYGNSVTPAGTALTMSGNLSGVIPGNNVNGAQMVVFSSLMNAYDERYRVLLQGNNSGLTSTATQVDRAPFHIQRGLAVADSANALGAGNGLKVIVGHNSSVLSNSLSGLMATSGNHVSGGIYVTTGVNGTQANNRNAVAQLGLSGPGSVNFTGPVTLQPSNSLANIVASLKLTASSGGQANFSGVISDHFNDAFKVPVTVLGEGTVKLSGNNTYRGTTAVRGGTLLLGHNSAMGLATTAVSLGDTVLAPSGGNVVAATTTETFGGTYTWNNGVYTWSSGALSALDGVTLNNGDRILVKDAAQDPQRNGVYIRTSSTTWTRATDLDSDAELVSGLRVSVAGGTVNGNKNFYLPNGLRPGAVINTFGGTTGAAFFFNPDAASNTDVAILTDAALTINRDITVTNNLSSGKSILGGNSAHASTFSGAVTLAKNLTVTAVSGGSATFSGDISGGFGVTKEGAGSVVFSTAKTYTGATAVTAGTLVVNANISTSNLTVSSGATLAGGGTVAGTVNVSSGGFISPGNSPGNLTLDNGLTLAGTYIWELGALSTANPGTDFDTITITAGNADITGASLGLNLGAFAPTNVSFWQTNQTWTGILNNTGMGSLTGFFGAIDNTSWNSLGSFSTTYTGNDVNLVWTAVPEPNSTALVGGLGVLALLRRRRA